MTDFIALTASSLAIGATMFLSAFLASSGQLERNGWVGIKISSTVSSDNAWRAGHKAALR